MKKSKIPREIFFLAVFTAITVFTWIGLEVYQTLSKKKTPKIIQSQLKPLDPNLDTEVIEGLKKRKLFGFQEVEIPKITPAEEATEGGEIHND